MPKFSQDWFGIAEKVFDVICEPFKGKDNLNFLEIGSFEGRSAIWLLDNILTGKNCKITCIDTFKGSNEFNEKAINVTGLEQTFLDNMKPYIGKYRLIKDLSQVACRDNSFINHFDFVYIDGSHEANDTLEDIVINIRNLKKGGRMIMDDYMWNWSVLPSHRTPKIAIDSFLGCYKADVKVLGLFNKNCAIEKI